MMTALSAPSFLPVPGGRVAYRDLGPRGAGPPLVLLHGGGVDGRMWARQVDALAGEHRLIVPDTRGHGASSTPDGPFRPHDDLARLLEHLDAGPTVLIGLSLGGRVAGDTALERPDLVNRIVVAGTGIGAPEFTDPWTLGVFAEWARTQQALDADGWVEAFLRFVPGPHRDGGEVDPLVLDEVRQMAVDLLAHHLPEDPTVPGPPIEFVADAAARAGTLRVPLLGVVGELDSGDHHRAVAGAVAAVPDGELVTVPGAAHYPNMERPAEFTAAVLRFLER
ncbi:alpha/beta fold hydrolase [Pseudonocardia nematodicida]|uniref:Alpha/beta fold hydrolase n=1 Tax=Pseudonocardia nematodicida TaxID=1206997 RepID=A0ABV1KC70_9PSEU